MEVKLIASPNGMKDVEDMIKFSQNCARICYTEKDFEEIQEEEISPSLQTRLINLGHHSVFEHINLTFNFKGIPKALAMVFNNERLYATSEKSARYTQMSDMLPEERGKYDKWMDLLVPEIDIIYPQMDDPQKRNIAVKKLAQENARYMTSVFTPTKMVHTINLTQLNFLIYEFEKFSEDYSRGDDIFKTRLATSMQEFLLQTQKFKVDGLNNRTDRHLSLFGKKVEENFSDEDYSTSYLLSFAGLTQAHRHRTINYHISGGFKMNAPLGFFTPEIVPPGMLYGEWLSDLSKLAENDFPQAQLIKINERGLIENFRSKAMLRMCGHAQYEIMKNTLETATKYKEYQSQFENSLTPKCEQGYQCPEPCIWTGKKALERVV